MEIQCGKWYGTGHLTANSAAIHAHTAKPVFPGLVDQYFNIVHFASPGQPVHHEEDGRIVLWLVLLILLVT
jgi:hypothetical protein